MILRRFCFSKCIWLYIFVIVLALCIIAPTLVRAECPTYLYAFDVEVRDFDSSKLIDDVNAAIFLDQREVSKTNSLHKHNRLLAITQINLWSNSRSHRDLCKQPSEVTMILYKKGYLSRRVTLDMNKVTINKLLEGTYITSLGTIYMAKEKSPNVDVHFMRLYGINPETVKKLEEKNENNHK